MFEKLESCQFLSLAFPHRLSPNAFCLAVFIKECHGMKIHKGAFEYDKEGVILFLSIFNIDGSNYHKAFDELVNKRILVLDSADSLWFSIDENIF